MAAIIDLDTARPDLKALLMRAKKPIALHKVVATAATRAVKDRFAEMAVVQRNRFGRPPMFWKRMNRATRPEATATTAAVIMPREVAQRYFGGTMRPTGGRKYLTIPAQAESYRRSARSFEDLAVVVFGKRLALVRRGPNETTVMYWLKRSVTQRGDKRVVPSLQELAKAVIRDVEAYLLRESALKR